MIWLEGRHPLALLQRKQRVFPIGRFVFDFDALHKAGLS